MSTGTDTKTAADEEDAVAFTAHVSVTNTSSIPGSTVVQIYAGPETSPPSTTPPQDPIKVLVGFTKLSLAPTERKTAHIPVKRRDLAHWDADKGKWIVRGGRWDVWFGESCRAECRVGVEVAWEG